MALFQGGLGHAEPQIPSPDALEGLFVHELSHGLLEPDLGGYGSKVYGLSTMYEHALDRLPQMYRTDKADIPWSFISDQVVRAVSVLMIDDFNGPDRLKADAVRLRFDELQGFYWTRQTVAALRDYQTNRDRYPTFESYVPILLDRLELVQEQMDWKYPKGPLAVWLFIMAAIAAAPRAVRMKRQTVARRRP